MLKLAAAGGLLAAGIGEAGIARADLPDAAGVDLAALGPTAIVIGSGFGGAVAALRLGQAGIRTLVLERGQHYRYSTTQAVFGNELKPVDASFWFQNVATWPTVPAVALQPVPGILQVLQEKAITVAAGAGVGGGSLVYGGCTVQPTRPYFEAIFPSRVSYSELDQVYYPRVRSMLRAATMPGTIYNSDPFTHSRAFDSQLSAAGYPTSPVLSTFNYAKVAQEISGTLRPSAIIGESTFGNSDGAKNDLTQNYLPAAVQTGQVTISPLTEVLSIGRNASGQYVVHYRTLAADGSVARTGQLTSRLLFLAAGSVGTTKLLLAARETGALPNLHSSIGTGWGANGDAFALRTFTGAPGASQAAPCASTRFVESGFGVPVRVENWYATALAGAPVSVQFSIAVDMDNRGTWTYDQATGEVHLSDWTADKNAPGENAAAAFNQMIIDKGLAGPFPPVPGASALTAHPLGGVPLGQATDFYGRVKGYPGLYVVDAATIPGNTGGANPSFTIAAMAERAMDQIISAR
jgi:cholesterol oxidase